MSIPDGAAAGCYCSQLPEPNSFNVLYSFSKEEKGCLLPGTDAPGAGDPLGIGDFCDFPANLYDEVGHTDHENKNNKCYSHLLDASSILNHGLSTLHASSSLIFIALYGRYYYCVHFTEIENKI